MNRSTKICLGILTIIWLVIVVVNTTPGKYFIGWDALSPELNYKVNLQRVFSAFWQENQGLGLLGGHGFAAVLPQVLISAILNIAIPANYVRLAFTFLMLFVGALGIFIFSRKILTTVFHSDKHLLTTQADLASLVASLFSMLNLGTIQMFYVPLEAFSMHFAGLPWLLYAMIKVFETRSPRNVLFLAGASFLFSTQGFIPPLFIAFLVTTVILLVSYVLIYRSKTVLTHAALIVCIIFATNAYWLMPFLYYVPTKSTIYINSYNNLLSTPEFIDKNHKYGNLADVALLKGFIFEALDSMREGAPAYVFDPWISHHKNPLVPLFGYLFFIGTIFGILLSLSKRKNPVILGLLLIFSFYFISIGTDIPILVNINRALQTIPVYNQAFRAAFTKFSIGLSLSYSVFLAIAVYHVLKWLSKNKNGVNISILATAFIIFLIGLFALPIFKGNLFYRRLTLSFPQAYRNVMSFFQHEDQNARIANLPQDCAEGWSNFTWGYTGSGFYWYGIKQPILDRAFDVWSNYNENYYWELTKILQSRHFNELDAFFGKYGVKWILYDQNVEHCRSTQGFAHLEEFIPFLQASPDFKETAEFTSAGIKPLKLFERRNFALNSFVTLESAPNIGPRSYWSDQDITLKDSQPYVTNQKEPYDVYYPFRSLFTKRRAEDKELNITENETEISLSNVISSNLNNYNAILPNFLKLEKILYAQLNIVPKGKGADVYLHIEAPKIYIDGLLVSNPMFEEKIYSFDAFDQTALRIETNNDDLVLDQKVALASEWFILPTQNAPVISIYNKSGKKLTTWTTSPESLSKQFHNVPQQLTISGVPTKIEVKIPKIISKSYGQSLDNQIFTQKPYSCNEISPSTTNKFEIKTEEGRKFLRLSSKNSRQCMAFQLEQNAQNTGYIVSIATRKISGRNPSFYIKNLTSRSNDLDVYLYSTNTWTNIYHILPPSYEFGLGRTIYFDNYSLTNENTINDLASLAIWPFPYNYISSIKFTLNNLTFQQNTQGDIKVEISHPNETYYLIKNVPIGDTKNRYLILSQAYDDGWMAWEVQCQMPNFQCQIQKAFPFLFGKQIKDHVLVNNWANGWVLPGAGISNNPIIPASPAGRQSSNNPIENQISTIILFFLPQLLEWIGFVLLPIPFLFLFLKRFEK